MHVRTMTILGRTAMLAAVVTLILLALPRGPSAESRHVEVSAFDFALEDVNPASPTRGQTLRLSDLYREGGLIVNFLASWCGPCRVELPLMQALHNAGPVPVLCVAADEYGGPRDVLPLVRASGLTMPVLFAPESDAKTLARHYDYTFLPATYLIDSRGVVKLVVEGIVDEDTLREEIAAHLGDDGTARLQ